MEARIIGESGRSRVDAEVRGAIMVLAGLLVCHWFIWVVELGGRVIVEW